MSATYFIRFVLKPREYELLHVRLLRRANCTPSPAAVYRSETESSKLQLLVRQHLRLYLKIWGGSALVNLLLRIRNGGQIDGRKLAASLVAVSASYRLSFDILSGLLKDRAQGSNLLKMLIPFASALVASPGFALLPSKIRPFLALYAASKAAEFVYNYLDDHGYMDWKPSVIGSWILFPIAMSQLFYTYINAPDYCPSSFKVIMDTLSGEYMPVKPEAYPAKAPWPTENQVLAAVGEISKLHFPTFKSPLLYRNQRWATSLKPIWPVLDYAHPGNTTMVGALLHPEEASEGKVFANTIASNFSKTSKYLFLLYFVVGVLKNQGVSPYTLVSSGTATLRTATAITMAVSSAWAGIGLSQKLLGSRVPPALRFRIIGFMSGLWAFLDQVRGRARNMYMLRLALLSHYNILRAKRGGKPFIQYGEVYLFGISMAVIAAVFNRYTPGVSNKGMRKIFNWLQYGDYSDPTPLPSKPDSLDSDADVAKI